MDLEDRQRPELAHRFLNAYVEATGDYGLLGLLPFYCTYRATVRAKVARIRLAQGNLPPAEAEHVRQACGGYVDLAARYTRPARPQLWITHGVSGSGKTRYTQHLVDATGAIRLRSDVERKRLAGLAPLERSTDRRKLELYTPAASQRTYAYLAQQARRVVQAGFTAIVDATFLQRTHRETFRRLAARLGVPFMIVDFHASADTLRRRVAQRHQQADDASEADLAVLDAQLATREPLTTAEQASTLPIDTEAPQALECLLDTIRAMQQEDHVP
jgi:predicted kinase